MVFILEFVVCCLCTMDIVQCSNHDMRARYNFHKDRTHMSTLWYSPYAAEELGMHQDIQEAFDNIGAGSLLSMNFPSYPALTSEFLASMQTSIDRPSNGNGYVRFRLGNIKRTMSLGTLNGIFGFPNPTEDYKTSWLGVERTWCLLTGQKKLPETTLRAGDIASPLFRVILRILGNTIWARRENSRPSEKEIGCIQGMLFVPRFYMNLGFEFLEHLRAYKRLNGEIWFGGMITKIAMCFNVDLTLYTSLETDFINRAYL